MWMHFVQTENNKIVTQWLGDWGTHRLSVRREEVEPEEGRKKVPRHDE